MGHRPSLKQKVKAMVHCNEALQLVGQGLPITEVASRMGIKPRSVRRHLRAALASSLYPGSLTPEKVAELRQLEGEKLNYLWQKLLESIEVTTTAKEDAPIRVRLVEAAVRVSEGLRNLFGLNVAVAPAISFTQQNNNLVITFERAKETERIRRQVMPEVDALLGLGNGKAPVGSATEPRGDHS